MSEYLLESERLLFRKFREDDAEVFFRMSSNPDVVRYTGTTAVTSVAEALERLRAGPLRDYAVHGFGRLACIFRENMQLVGANGFKYNPCVDLIDIGYLFLPEYWGRGLATESSIALLKYGREVMELEDIVAAVEPEHTASAAVLKKIGMHCVDRIDWDGTEVDLYR